MYFSTCLVKSTNFVLFPSYEHFLALKLFESAVRINRRDIQKTTHLRQQMKFKNKLCLLAAAWSLKKMPRHNFAMLKISSTYCKLNLQIFFLKINFSGSSMCITARLFGSDLSWLGFAEAQVCRPTQYIRSLPSSTTTI